MSKLRRHDWRCHREVEFNICGEFIKCRQDIKKHREIVHGCSERFSVNFSLHVWMKMNVFMSMEMNQMKWIQMKPYFAKTGKSVMTNHAILANRVTHERKFCAGFNPNVTD
jgi:hypothetical protein